MKLALTFSILLFLATNSFGQFTAAERFHFVPEEHRPKLKEKLEKFIGYYRADDWSGIYDCLCSSEKTKKEFLENKYRDIWGLGKLVNFNPVVRGVWVDTPKSADSAYTLTGCVDFEKGENYRHNLSAFLVKGDWCFGTIYPTDTFEMTKKTPCQMRDYETSQSKTSE